MKAGDRAFIVESLRDKMGGSKSLITPVVIVKLPVAEGEEYIVRYITAGQAKPFRVRQVFYTRAEALKVRA